MGGAPAHDCRGGGRGNGSGAGSCVRVVLRDDQGRWNRPREDARDGFGDLRGRVAWRVHPADRGRAGQAALAHLAPEAPPVLRRLRSMRVEFDTWKPALAPPLREGGGEWFRVVPAGTI